MRKFDIYLALGGCKVQTQGGVEVKHLHVFSYAKKSHIVYGVTSYGEILNWQLDGAFGNTIDQYPEMNLVIVD